MASSREQAIASIRLGTAWTVAEHVVPCRIAGPDAFAALDRLLAGELFLRDGQARAGLLLRDDGRVLADVTICRDADDYVLLAEGPSPTELRDHLGSQAEVLSDSHAVLTVAGPWSWELLEAFLEPDAGALPYLTFFHHERALCLRAGKTGEYGYDLLVPREELDRWVARLLEAGRSFDLERVDLDALDQCALENAFFNARREGRSGAGPIELQLQWRLAIAKEARGMAAIRDHRAAARSRSCWALAPARLDPGDAVTLDDRALGTILAAGHSPTRGQWVAIALLESGFAHPGVRDYVASTSGGLVQLETVSPPVIHNRSLAVDPRRHRYAGAASETFPPLVP